MDSAELNKYIMGFLATVFGVMSVAILSDSIFSSHAPEKPGFIIEAAEAAAGGDTGTPVAEAVPIATLMASADPARGEAIFKKCAACHTADKGGANKVGPNLFDIVNRPMATHAGFSYSGAMKEFSQGGTVLWDYDHLNHFLTSPKGYIKGTAMGFAGDKKDNERADLIAYLRTLADSPAPLPEAAPAAAPAEGAAPAAEGAAPAAEGTAPAPAPAGEAPATPAPAQ